jgi:hypothetical protein
MASPYEPVIAHLNVPENRIKYAHYHALGFQHSDKQMHELALMRMMEWIQRVDDAEYHY